MADEHDSKLDDLRERLYERPPTDPDRGRSELSHHEEVRTPSAWQQERTITPPQSAVIREAAPLARDFPMPMKRRHKFRLVTLVGGALFFIIAAILASTYLFFGKNNISGSNITLEARGPFATGGGEVFDFTVSVTNQNNVPIDNAALILEYPNGTKTATEPQKDLPRERRTIDRIGAGEVLNIPLSAVIYGEEGEEREIRVTIEYRVEGSNATFYRDAEPLHFKITSSPVAINVDALHKITSGQEMEFTISVVSNSPTELRDLVVQADYPFGFDFSEADPQPASGENVWRIASLGPEQKKTIKVKGIVTGKNEEKRIFAFKAGAANEHDPYKLASVLATENHELTMEQAFVDLGMSINGKSSDTVVISSRDPALFDITFRNTLGDTIYDAKIEVTLDGNALNEHSVAVNNGFYDSSKNTITWDAISVSNLREIAPGQSSNVTFSLTPFVSEDLSRTPQIVASVSVRGKRVAEAGVPEKLTDTVSRTLKIESNLAVAADVFYTIGPFINQGPIPPVAESPTTYTAVMLVKNGTNAVTDAVVEASLPPYVSWSKQTSTDVGKITYNESTRTVSWNIGDVEAGAVVTAFYQVTLLPSLTQVGTIPALVTGQRLRANDRFTGSVVRATTPDLSTQMNGEEDPTVRDGRVQNP